MKNLSDAIKMANSGCLYQNKIFGVPVSASVVDSLPMPVAKTAEQILDDIAAAIGIVRKEVTDETPLDLRINLDPWPHFEGFHDLVSDSEGRREAIRTIQTQRTSRTGVDPVQSMGDAALEELRMANQPEYLNSLEAFTDRLYQAGWRPNADAQHTGAESLLSQLREDLAQRDAEVERLEVELEKTELRALKFIHQCNARVDLYRELKARYDALESQQAASVGGGEFGDAYQGAREDMAIWKRRALEAEAKVREQDQIIENLGNALNAENGPTFMGEPVLRVAASVGGEREAFEAWAASVGYHTERDMFQREKYQSTLTWELWRVWQARATLSPAGGGVVDAPACRICEQRNFIQRKIDEAEA